MEPQSFVILISFQKNFNFHEGMVMKLKLSMEKFGEISNIQGATTWQKPSILCINNFDMKETRKI